MRVHSLWVYKPALTKPRKRYKSPAMCWQSLFANGPTDKEVQAAKDFMIGGFALRLDSNRKLLDNLGNIAWFDLPLDYLDTWSAEIDKLSATANSASLCPQLATRAHGDGYFGRQTLKPGEVRIIGGEWKRSKLPLPRSVELRPTPDRVRETLFNWLGQDLTGWHCLDAFAGTGALGFEAASRGATHVLLCDTQAVCIETMAKSQAKLGAHQLRLVRGDGLAALRQQAPTVWTWCF
jgi:hypothetical protein